MDKKLDSSLKVKSLDEENLSQEEIKNKVTKNLDSTNENLKSKTNQMSLKRRIIFYIVPRFGLFLAKTIYFLTRKQFIFATPSIIENNANSNLDSTNENLNSNKTNGQQPIKKSNFPISPIKSNNAIIAFWHGETLMMPHLYANYREFVGYSEQNLNVYIMASNHFDGGLIARMCELFGMKTIRGSTDRGGVKALLESIKALNNGFDVGIAIDGPRGPYHHISDGIIMMAQKTNKPIAFCRILPSAKIRFNTWDKFIIPLPFCKICYDMSEHIYIDPELSLEQAMEVLKKHIAKKDD